MTIAPEAPTTTPLIPGFLELEITRRCQLMCETHCYAQAGPTQGHGVMTGDDWKRVISEAAALGGLQGKSSVQEVVQAVMSAEQSLQAALAIRDKVVAAYQEISRMAI